MRRNIFGTLGTVTASAKIPGAVLLMFYEYPATRTSTLATLDEAVTAPLRTSPGCTTLALIENDRISGGASGATYGTSVAGGTGSPVFCTLGVAGAIVAPAAFGSPPDGSGDGAGAPERMVAPGKGIVWTERAPAPLEARTDDGTDAEPVVEGTWTAPSPCPSASTRRRPGLGRMRIRARTVFMARQRSFLGSGFHAPNEGAQHECDQATEDPLLSVVVPLFNEEGNVAALLERIVAIVTALPGAPSYEIVLVNDGSTDATIQKIRDEMTRRANVVLVDLSRNFGHQIAATAGVEIARGAAVVVMDGDLQDPPELIAEFLVKYREGYDVVYAVRRSRKGESPFKLLTASLFYRTIRKLTRVSIPVDTGDFRLMSRRVVEALKRSPERHRFLRGLVSWVGYRQTGVEYDRDERLSGVTKYPFTKMVGFAVDGITSFSDVPLRFASYVGFGAGAVALLLAIAIAIFKISNINPPQFERGWASTITAILFLGGVQLISLGILGEIHRPHLRRGQEPSALSDQRDRTLISRPSRRSAPQDDTGEGRRGRTSMKSERSRRCESLANRPFLGGASPPALTP